MVRTLTPRALKPTATGSQDLRVVLHICSSTTPGPGLPAVKKVARSLVPSGEVISTSLGTGACAEARVVNNSRTERRRDRGMRLHLRIKRMPSGASRNPLKNNPRRAELSTTEVSYKPRKNTPLSLRLSIRRFPILIAASGTAFSSLTPLVTIASLAVFGYFSRYRLCQPFRHR